MWVQTLSSAFLCLHVCTATPVNKNNVIEVWAPPGGGWCVFDLCVSVCACSLALLGKAPLRQAYTEQLRSSAGAPEALQRRRDSEVDEWEWSREKGGGRFSQGEERGGETRDTSEQVENRRLRLSVLSLGMEGGWVKERLTVKRRAGKDVARLKKHKEARGGGVAERA